MQCHALQFDEFSLFTAVIGTANAVVNTIRSSIFKMLLTERVHRTVARRGRAGGNQEIIEEWESPDDETET